MKPPLLLAAFALVAGVWAGHDPGSGDAWHPWYAVYGTNYLYRDLEVGGSRVIKYEFCGDPLPAFWITGIENWDYALPQFEFQGVVCDSSAKTRVRWEGSTQSTQCLSAITSACWRPTPPTVTGPHHLHRDITGVQFIYFDAINYPNQTNQAAVSVAAHEWGHNIGLADDFIDQISAGSVMGSTNPNSTSPLLGPTAADLFSVTCSVYRLCDSDGDAFADAEEDEIGTTSFDGCSNTPFANDEDPDPWPPDFDDDQRVDIGDVLRFKGLILGTVPPVSPRFDLAVSRRIDISDVIRLKPVFGKTCTP